MSPETVRIVKVARHIGEGRRLYPSDLHRRRIDGAGIDDGPSADHGAAGVHGGGRAEGVQGIDAADAEGGRDLYRVLAVIFVGQGPAVCRIDVLHGGGLGVARF